ncbi:hypothetical protein TRVA0_009S00386 [Trichomonascus vanleenenianus]|uniref:Uip5p n=1 Tax=Trichomonascus vanleenenianus TaxID=2268995 RepID=UPI003ECB452C
MSFRMVEQIPFRIAKPYIDKGTFSSRNYHFGGDVIIKNDEHVRLTADRPDQRGWFFSKNPLLLDSFQIDFEFKIHGQGGAIYGDGMAFWILNEQPAEGPVFGIKDNFDGFAIFFDTYKNERPGKAFPYIVAMHGDGKTPYDHDHDGAANELAGCSARGLHNAEGPSKARVTYVEGKFLSLELNYRGKDKWEKCFSINGVVLPKEKYIGFSGQTGELSENHDLYTAYVWKFGNPPQSFSEVDYVQNGRVTVDYTGQSSSSSGGWLWTIVKFLLLAGVVAGAYVGYGLYRVNKKKKDPYYLS